MKERRKKRKEREKKEKGEKKRKEEVSLSFRERMALPCRVSKRTVQRLAGNARGTSRMLDCWKESGEVRVCSKYSCDIANRDNSIPDAPCRNADHRVGVSKAKLKV